MGDCKEDQNTSCVVAIATAMPKGHASPLVAQSASLVPPVRLGCIQIYCSAVQLCFGYHVQPISVQHGAQCMSEGFDTQIASYFRAGSSI